MTRFARGLSILFHPFVMVVVLVGAAAFPRQSAAEALQSVAVVGAFTIVPLLLLMIRQVRTGTWEHADASRRAERRVLYAAGGTALVTLLAYVTLTEPRSFMVRGVSAALAMMLVCGVLTTWIKVSLHMAFAALAATALGLMGSPVGFGLLLSLPALAWSRRALARHTPGEVMTGAIIGVAAGAGIHYW
jgi:hypothetical protein